MIIVMPTCDTHAHVAEWSAALLKRHWPDHPPLHVLHHDVRPGIPDANLHYLGADRSFGDWASRMVEFLADQGDDTFLIFLDDYALCGPPNAARIADANRLAHRPDTGFVRLGWQPGTVHPGPDGFVRLGPTLVTMQAAVWRRDYFLKLVEASGRCSIWGFEGEGTQAIKRLPGAIYGVDESGDDSGFFLGASSSSVLPYRNLMHRGRLNEAHYDWLIQEGFSPPSRGLGDTIAKAATKIGVAAAVGAVSRAMGVPCGCGRRQSKLNEIVPYTRSENSGRGGPGPPR